MTGKELKALRIKLGLTQGRLAEKIGARGPETISEWENSDNPNISKSFLILINLLKDGKI